MTVSQCLRDLVDYGVRKGLVEEEDRAYTLNLLLDCMRMDAPEAAETSEASSDSAAALTARLADEAVRRGLIADTAGSRELFETRLMGALTPHPAAVRAKFEALYATSPETATNWFYELCRACDYIRVARIAKNVRFRQASPCGELEITINLSKPEKDPRDIAAQKNAPKAGYPACMLCEENPGYAGRADYPARQNHRVIPLSLSGEKWFLQYSPYLYYNEHCIVFCQTHRPMRVNRMSLEHLCDFVDLFPHYFIGSNADLPIVGGSILSHDHFQGGNYTFPMDRAGTRAKLVSPDKRVSAELIDWPMSAVRLTSDNREALIELSLRVLDAWRGYSDPACDILAQTDAPHNTVTPILRREGSRYRMDLVLRNNRVSEEHPLGIFHPHAELHHIKKENIGLIEVMGLFILPGRLLGELTEGRKFLTGERDIERTPDAQEPVAKHYAWLRAIREKLGGSVSPQEADEALHQALADTCARVLADAGVYKNTPEGTAGALRFLKSAGFGA